MPSPGLITRPRAGTRGTIAIGFGFALVVHAFLILLLATTDLFDRAPRAIGSRGAGTALATGAAGGELDDPDLAAGCAADVALAASARTLLCFAPWQDGAARPTCLHDAEVQGYMDLSGCSAANEPSTAVAMIDPKTLAQIEKQKPLDAEQLLDEIKPPDPDKPTPPPPTPQLQVQPPTPPPPPPPPAVQRPHQVVETAKPDHEDKEPEDARYLAEYNTRADKQKVARGAADEKMVAKSKPKELKATDKPKDDPAVKQVSEAPPGKRPDAPPTPGTLSMRRPGPNAPQAREPQDQKTRGSTSGARGPEVADGYLQRRGNGAIEQERHQREEQPRGDNGGGGGAPPIPNLRPTREQLERIVGGGNVDHVDDANDSDETALTAKRWVYASFFNRMKRQVAQNWDPQTTWRRIDPNGSVYGFKTRVTEVRVSLSATGAMANIVVTTPCGVGELDDEAVRAFKAAAPFPNPPDGLVKDGLITFAFSFYFEIGQPRSAWRVVRTY